MFQTEVGDGTRYVAGNIWGCSPAKRGVFLHERLVGWRGGRISVRGLGGARAGEMRITRFLHNSRVSVAQIMAQAFARTAARCGGRHVLALQDTSMVRAAASGAGVALHPVLAVDAADGAVLGLCDAEIMVRAGGARATRKVRTFEDKQSHRWLRGALSAARLRDGSTSQAAACVTVVCDREGDIYEEFALRPAAVELLIRAGQDRRLHGGGTLFAHTDALPVMGRMRVDLPAAPGRKARTAELELRFGCVEIVQPKRSKSAQAKAEPALPAQLTLTVVDAREVGAPAGQAPAHWRLLTTHHVQDVADARRITHWYRLRWTIEQLFRTLKTQGFDVEATRQIAGGPLENLTAVVLCAAVTVMQLVHERDGKAKRPIEDVVDADDWPVLVKLCAASEGKTAKQKNPHPHNSLAYAAWVFARLGGWTGYYGKPGPIVMLRGFQHFHAIKHGWNLRLV